MKQEFISISSFRRFVADEAGAVTVDFVVLTGAIVGLGLAVTGSVASGGMSLADLTSDAISDVDVGYSSASDEVPVTESSPSTDTSPTDTSPTDTTSNVSPQQNHHDDDD